MDDIHFTQRGVEHLTKEFKYIRCQRIEAARFAVLDEELHSYLEQDEREHSKTRGRTTTGSMRSRADRIAAAYSAIVRESTKAAYKRGQLDEQFVNEEEEWPVQHEYIGADNFTGRRTRVCKKTEVQRSFEIVAACA